MPRFKFTTKMIAFASLATALVTGFTLLGFSSAQFYFNFGDTIILIVSALFGPVIGGIAGGLGSFLADFAVYPVTMFYTLFIKGVEGFLCGLFLSLVRKKVSVKKKKLFFSFLTMFLSVLWMALGYFLCQTLFYGSVKTALVALPMDVVQGVASFTLASCLLYLFKMDALREKLHLELHVQRRVKKTETLIAETQTKKIENKED